MKQYSNQLTHLAYMGATALVIGLICIGARSYAAEETVAATAEGAPQAKIMMDGMDDRKGMMQERRENMASNTAAIQEQMQEHRSILAQKIQDRIYNLLQNIVSRMEAAAYRLSAIGNRMEMRARTISERGGDVTEVMTHIEKSRTAIAAATNILHSNLGSFVLTEKPREQFAQVKASIKEAGAHIKDARDALRAALAALKTASTTAKPADAEKPITSTSPVSE